MDFCGIREGELDLLDASPPCQGFSTAGKRRVMDNRNDLFLEFVRLTKEIRPKIFLMENVSGMVKGKMKGRFKEIIIILKSLDYNVRCKLLNTKYYNVPQSRERLIFMGIRKDFNILPSFPKPNIKIITVKKILEGVIPKTKIILSENEKFYYRKMKQGESASKYHPNGSWFGFIKVNPNKPSPTIIKSAGKGLCHWNEERHFSYNELQILCSFPENFIFIGNKSNKIDRIGNAVAPKFMEAIALHIRKIMKW